MYLYDAITYSHCVSRVFLGFLRTILLLSQLPLPFHNQMWVDAKTTTKMEVHFAGKIMEHHVWWIKLRLSNYGSATTAQQLRLSNHGSATTAQQPRLSNQTRFSLQQLCFSNYASATKTNSRFSNYGSATKIYSRFSNQTSATKTHPLWQVHAQSHLTHHIKIPPPPWQVHAQSHLPRHIKIAPPPESTCTVSSYT